MADENKQPSVEELDAQIKALQDQKKKCQGITALDYNCKPLREKLAYDFSPMKILTSAVKTVITIIIIGALVFGYGYWKGKGSKPVYTDSKDFTMELICKDTGKTHQLVVKNGRYYFDGKVVTASNLPKLKPYGIELHPKLFAGVGTKGPAIGAGFEFAHFYKLNADIFFMSDKAIYAGISYDLSMDTTKSSMNWFENSAIGLAVGKGLNDPTETRFMLYWTIKF